MTPIIAWSRMIERATETDGAILEALKTVIDPELGVDILGS
jgi:metal-sulfur cluster biosynthetic enzyme